MHLSRSVFFVCLAAGVLVAGAGALAALGLDQGAGALAALSLAAGAAVALASLPLGLVVRRAVGEPARALTESARVVAQGRAQALDAPRPGGAPMDALHDAVAAMAQALAGRAQAAEAEAADLRARLDAVQAEMGQCREREEGSRATLDKLRATANRAFSISAQVAYSAEGLASQVMEAGHGTRLQQERVAETATAMEEMNATVLEVARNASAAADGAASARARALAGADVVQRAVTAIGRVSALSEELRGNMGRLGTQAEAIGQVMTVISDIADQTNLLALNAAIEAARAGDAGRGFAVVADEVRKLAEKTMTATQEVGASIRAIQQAARDNQKSMEEAAHAVEEATGLAGESGAALGEIVSLVDDSSGQAQSIAAASEEQSAASEEINRAIEEVNTVASDTAEGMAAASKAVKDLAGLAAELQQLFEELLGSGGARLAHSATEMRGILPKMMQDFVRKQYGEAVYEQMVEEMGRPTFLANRSYPDKVMEQMAGIVAARKGLEPGKVLYEFGYYTPTEFKKLYRRYFKTTDLKEFYLNMNRTHAELTREEPGITPPRFSYEDKGDVLIMNYHSKRALFTYFEGILNGIAKLFGRKVRIAVTAKGADTARAEIRFL